ncbi:hypothetical protein [Glutamicibacter sp.]|uniref:hypothetical protein n=1 Tax=Glutamicibacter sp. TaxID=1931995 RepID=UPI002B469FD7|nr:hypothetical protein [Glutamicibacter sp.]HJX77316.1 hypothetical protein [Glutamicibacter sp.]
MPNQPALNPDALLLASQAVMSTVYSDLPDEEMHTAVVRIAVSAYLQALPTPAQQAYAELYGVDDD